MVSSIASSSSSTQPNNKRALLPEGQQPPTKKQAIASSSAKAFNYTRLSSEPIIGIRFTFNAWNSFAYLAYKSMRIIPYLPNLENLSITQSKDYPEENSIGIDYQDFSYYLSVKLINDGITFSCGSNKTEHYEKISPAFELVKEAIVHELTQSQKECQKLSLPLSLRTLTYQIDNGYSNSPSLMDKESIESLGNLLDIKNSNIDSIELISDMVDVSKVLSTLRPHISQTLETINMEGDNISDDTIGNINNAITKFAQAIIHPRALTYKSSVIGNRKTTFQEERDEEGNFIKLTHDGHDSEISEGESEEDYSDDYADDNEILGEMIERAAEQEIISFATETHSERGEERNPEQIWQPE